MTSSARITPDGRLGRIVNYKTGITLAGGGHLIAALGHLIGGNEEKAVEELMKLGREDVDAMYGVVGGLMSKLIVAGSLHEMAQMVPGDSTEEEGGLRCPTCGSPQPSMHPSVSDGGEVTGICRDAFHGTVAEHEKGEPH